MRFNIAAAAVAGGLGFAFALGSAGVLAMLIGNDYAKPFLEMLASIYPEYKADGTARDLVVGCFYAATDGVIAGGGLALLYNLAASIGKKSR